MPVHLTAAPPQSIHAVAGVRLGTAMAGIRKADRPDLTVMTLDEGS